jgi:hypothetical protein
MDTSPNNRNENAHRSQPVSALIIVAVSMLTGDRQVGATIAITARQGLPNDKFNRYIK